MRINPHFLKTQFSFITHKPITTDRHNHIILNFWNNPQFPKSDQGLKKSASLAPQKWNFGPEKILFAHQIYEPCVFCKKTALNLVKCGLHSPTYYFLPHIGGPHPVLYFTIQATEKYSNSNVLPFNLIHTTQGNSHMALLAIFIQCSQQNSFLMVFCFK